VAATIAITQPIHAAATLLYAVRIALAANTPAAQNQWDVTISQMCQQLEQTLRHFSLQEIASDLSVDDRATYLILLSQLSSIVNIYQNPIGSVPRVLSLMTLRDQLAGIDNYLRPFDQDLAEAFLRDASLPHG
jgi:hypothetical protein